MDTQTTLYQPDNPQMAGCPVATCSLIYSAWLENWFVIEPYEGTGQPEGSGEEWREILAAMQERRHHSFRRIGVEFDAGGNAWFWSPRNSMGHQAAEVPAAQVDAWIARAKKIVEAYSANDPSSPMTAPQKTLESPEPLAGQSLGAARGSDTWTCRMCNGHGGHAEGCPGESEHIQLLSELKSALDEYPKIPNEVWIGTDSDVDKVRWLARRCEGSDRTISRLHDEKMELLTLLKSLHEWFMEKSPDNYNGCGLWIDVDATLRESPNSAINKSHEIPPQENP